VAAAGGVSRARSPARPRPPWLFLLRPKWLCWHAFAVVATVGMLWLGDWQLRRALSGNELSWAYTVEWPLFAGCGAIFWVKSLREEMRLQAAGGGAGDPGGTAGAADVTGPADGSGHAAPVRAPAAGPGTQLNGTEVPDGRDASGVAAASEAYLARLTAEVQGHGKWHGWR
jgi:hypothetical protein